MIGLVQVGAQAHADRYTYLPSIGLCWAVAWALPDASALARRTSTALAVAVCVALAATTRDRFPVWQDGVRLFAHATEVIPGNAPALLHLGNAWAAADRLPEAADAYRERARDRFHVCRGEPSPRSGAGAAASRRGGARDTSKRRSASIPRGRIRITTSAVLAVRHRDFAGAREHLARARELRPDFAPIRLHYGSGLVLQSLGETAAARAELEAAARLDPHSSEARNALRALSPEGP